MSSGGGRAFDGWGHSANVHPEKEYELARPPRPVVPDEATVFVEISSYRDGGRCGLTLSRLFSKARWPDRVFVGVVDQVGPPDQSCIAAYCALMAHGGGDRECARSHQVRVLTMDARQSKGPTLARARCQAELLQDEDFCLQIDSHMDVVDEWDVELVREWVRADNEYGVLTTYVHMAQHLTEYFMGPWRFDVPHICRTMHGAHGMVRNERAASVHALSRPKLNVLWAAGFSFAKCHMDRNVPYDPNLPHIFDGEEFSRMSRLWTRGYDVYTPSRNLVFHNYQSVPHSWMQDNAASVVLEQNAAINRLRKLWDMPGARTDTSSPLEPPFNLGSCRSYDQLVAFTGVNPRTGQISNGSRCFDLQWVPWTTDSGDCPQVPDSEQSQAAGDRSGVPRNHSNDFDRFLSSNQRHSTESHLEEIERMVAIDFAVVLLVAVLLIFAFSRRRRGIAGNAHSSAHIPTPPPPWALRRTIKV